MKHLLVACLLVAACSSTSTTAEPTKVPAGGPPVVITIVVDQFAAWVANERFGLLPEDGGFARLRREGTYVRALRYEHGATETACGHAALYTGAPPSRSGIMSNESLDGGRVVSTMQDASTKLVLAGGESARAGASPHRLRVEGVADVLREEQPDAVVIGLSLKDRGAILPVGHKPSAAVWLDIDTGELVTSTYFANALPTWAAPISASIPQRLEAPWTLLDADWVKSHAITPDDQDGEEPSMRVFPHDLLRETAIGSAVRLSPESDGMLVDLALAALDASPRKRTMLSISFSTNDIIGHTFGPDSWEAWDGLRRLDGQLARLLEGLDQRFGSAGYAVVLSADHGVAPIPEVASLRPECAANAKADTWERPCGNLARVAREPIASQLKDVAARVLGEGKWVYGFVGAFVALTPEGRAQRQKLMPALLAELQKNPNIARAIDVATLPQTCPAAGIEALVCNAHPTDSAGDIMIVLKSGAGFGDGSGASHGMPYTYDLTVPFLARAPGRIQVGRYIDAELPIATFTHTVAKLLGVRPPNAASPANALD